MKCTQSRKKKTRLGGGRGDNYRYCKRMVHLYCKKLASRHSVNRLLNLETVLFAKYIFKSVCLISMRVHISGSGSRKPNQCWSMGSRSSKLLQIITESPFWNLKCHGFSPQRCWTKIKRPAMLQPCRYSVITLWYRTNKCLSAVDKDLRPYLQYKWK